MIGLLLLYFLGKYFYALAALHQKSKWLFAILGVLSYYLGALVFGVIIVLFIEFVLNESTENMSDAMLSLMAVPFGLLTAFVFYSILKKVWSKAQPNVDALDHEFVQAEVSAPEKNME
ncbi:MAG: hypothetical protein RL226_2093 [Bacteroidota bacterium]|jgi:ABC-type nickel/cobalt efflux system permease component RcnA